MSSTSLQALVAGGRERQALDQDSFASKICSWRRINILVRSRRTEKRRIWRGRSFIHVEDVWVCSSAAVSQTGPPGQTLSLSSSLCCQLLFTTTLQADTHLWAAAFARFLRRLFHLLAVFVYSDSSFQWRKLLSLLRAWLWLVKDNSVSPLSTKLILFLLKLPGFFSDNLELSHRQTFHLQYISHIFEAGGFKTNFWFH